MERKITALEPQKKNPNRVNIYLDDEFAFGLSRLYASGLIVGQSLSDDKIRELKNSDINDLGMQKALNFLRYRSRSEQEVHQNLRKHGFSEDVINQIIERLRQMNLVNDIDFANSWVDNRSEFKPRGRIALQSELRAKGIDSDIINEVLSDIDEEKLAYEAAQKQAHKYKNLDWKPFQKKMLGFLTRRGFNYSVAGPIVKKIWREFQNKLEKESIEY